MIVKENSRHVNTGERYEQGCLVKSLAGHDKDELFVILREEGEYLYLAI